jgi:hypothetical protein
VSKNGGRENHPLQKRGLSGQALDIVMSMIETPLRFLEVNEKFFLPESTKFCHTKLRVTSKRFNAVDMIFTPRKFILVVMDVRSCSALGNTGLLRAYPGLAWPHIPGICIGNFS